MDGLKSRMTASLQGRLSLWLTLIILAATAMAGIFGYAAAVEEAHELQDSMLRQMAVLFDHHSLPAPLDGDAGGPANKDEEARVFVQFWPDTPTNASGSERRHQLALPSTLIAGLQTVDVENKSYRILVKELASGKRVVVAQETAIRDEIARESALRTTVPMLILVPILLLVVADLIRRILRPIAALSVEIRQRNGQDLRPFAPDLLPVEIRPFLVAINELFERVSQLLQAQQRFVSDAAHELRSPLTALSLQAEALADWEMSLGARVRIAKLLGGVRRARTLLDQLLAYARVQSAPAPTISPVPLLKVYRRVIEDLMPLADAKGIDLGLKSESDAMIHANEVDLFILARNLVDNAIRYTPAGGRVDLSVSTNHDVVVLVVEDNGPGIPENERARVFDPFYRLLGNEEVGSGLGLSIARAIADRIGAYIHLSYSNDLKKQGLRVEVAFPRTEDHAKE